MWSTSRALGPLLSACPVLYAETADCGEIAVLANSTAEEVSHVAGGPSMSSHVIFERSRFVVCSTPLALWRGPRPSGGASAWPSVAEPSDPMSVRVFPSGG